MLIGIRHSVYRDPSKNINDSWSSGVIAESGQSHGGKDDEIQGKP